MGQTYFNRKFMISGKYTDAPSQADPFIGETREERDNIDHYANAGEVIKLHFNAVSFGATVGDGSEVCTDISGVTLSNFCVGSSAPKEFSSPLFYITCDTLSVVTFDPYRFDPSASSSLYTPWLCSADPAIRPTWKMLGYFDRNAGCDASLGTLNYVSDLCT